MNLINDLFIVAIGSSIGGSGRYMVSVLLQNKVNTLFPFATFIVNFIGSFIIGLIFFYSEKNWTFSPKIKLLLTTGFCGGFTTFSTFSLEVFKLLQMEEYKMAGIYIFLSLLVSVLSIFLSYWVVKPI